LCIPEANIGCEYPLGFESRVRIDILPGQPLLAQVMPYFIELRRRNAAQRADLLKALPPFSVPMPSVLSGGSSDNSHLL